MGLRRVLVMGEYTAVWIIVALLVTHSVFVWWFEKYGRLHCEKKRREILDLMEQIEREPQ